LILEPLHLINNIQTAMHDERIHLACFGGEASDAIAALFRSAEFELKERFVIGVNDAEVVGHDKLRNPGPSC